MECHPSRSPYTKTEKRKLILNSKKVIVTVFWDRKGVLPIDYFPRGETINAAAYCQTLHRLHRAIQNKGCGLLSSNGVLLVLYNVRPHSDVLRKNMLLQFREKRFDERLNSPSWLRVISICSPSRTMFGLEPPRK